MKSLRLNQPHIIAVIGVPGSGKSFFAEKFTDTFHAPYVDYDTLVQLGSASQAAARRIFNYQVEQLLKSRQSIIIEGPIDTRAERLDLQKKAKAAGYEVLFVWVQTAPATAEVRATRKMKDSKKQPLTLEEYDRIAARFIAPQQSELPVVISGKHTYATQAKVVLKRLSAPRAEAISTRDITPRKEDKPQRSSRGNIAVR